MAKKLTSKKAREILHDKSVHGNPLTEKQRKFFGAVAGGAKPYKAESGGWLDEYDAPQAQNGIEGTMGGLTDKGFDYNGAWGGQFQLGGNVYPVNYVPEAQVGKDVPKIDLNLPKYKEPPKQFFTGYGYGFSPDAAVKMYGVGAYGKTALTPRLDLSGTINTQSVFYPGGSEMFMKPTYNIGMRYKFENGGSTGGTFPGSVGFMYARTQGAAPSEGPYAKKTMPSAEDGMSFYQHGLDWKPRNISRDGSEIPMAQGGDRTPINRMSLDEQMRNLRSAQQRTSDSYTQRPADLARVAEASRQKELKAKRERQGEIRAAGPKQSVLSRAAAIATHPMSALQYKLKGQDIPENFERGNINPYEYATDVVNPFIYGKAAYNTLGNLFSPIETTKTLGKGAVNLLSNLTDNVNVFDDGSNEKALGIVGDALIAAQVPGIYKNSITKIGRDLARIEKQGLSEGLSSHDIAKRQLEQVGITSNQRKAYIPGVSEFLEETVVPYGYGGFGNESKLTQTLKNIFGKDKSLSKYSSEGVLSETRNPSREDAWSLYLGRPQRYNTFRMAETAPVNHPSYPSGSLKDMDIYSVNYEDELIPKVGQTSPNVGTSTNAYIIEKKIEPLIRNITLDREGNVMGGYNRRLSSSGLEYNDVWNLEPEMKIPFTDKKIKIPIDKFIGKPFMSHGNIPYTWAEHQSNLTKFLDSKIADRLAAQMETGVDFTPQVSRLLQQLEKVKSAVPIKKKGGVIKDDRGQWAHPGEITEISSPNITMQGVPYPVLGIGRDGQQIMMQPGQDYKFNKGPITEIPMAQTGVEQTFQEGTDFLRDWYSKRAQLPQFQDLATRRLQDIDRFSYKLEPYSEMKNVGVGYYPHEGGDIVYVANPEDPTIPEAKRQEYIPTKELIGHELTHGLTRRNPQIMPEGFFTPIPFEQFDIYNPEKARHSADEYYYNWINTAAPIEYTTVKGKQKTKMAPGAEVEGTIAMLRSLEKLDPLKTYTPEDVVPMIEKYKTMREMAEKESREGKGYQMENAPQMIEFMFRNYNYNPKKIASLLNELVKTGRTDVPIAQDGNITPFYKDEEDKRKYQEALTNLYYGELDRNNASVKPYLSKNRSKIIDPVTKQPVSEDFMTCIDGVCGIMEKAGKKWNAGTVDGHYIGNETFYDNVYLNKKEDAYQATGNFQVGDIIQAGYDTGKRFRPSDAKVIVAIEEDDDGNKIYHTSGGSGGTSLGGSSYTEENLKRYIKDKKRVVTRPGYQLDKGKLAKERINNPEAIKAIEEREKNWKFESEQGIPWQYSLREDATDVNKDNKYAQAFLEFANNNTKVEDLARKLNVPIADVHDELLNTFGELGQETKFGTTVTPETVFENIFKPKTKSIGPGQIRFSTLDPELKKKLNINKTKDLYDEEKLIPLMTAINLRNRAYLKNKGEKLSEDLIGIPGVDWKNIKGGIGRWTPYMYQATKIDGPRNYAKRKLQEQTIFGQPTEEEVDEFYNKDRRYYQRSGDEGSYANSVFDYIDRNLQRESPLFNTVRPLREVEVVGKKKKKETGGWLDEL